MSIVKSALAATLAAGTALAVSATAFAATSATTTATATPTPTPTHTPTPAPTPTPSPAAGPLTIALTCDTGPGGSGTFSVSANGKSSTVTGKCGKSASVSNAVWKAGSTATIHQTAATASGQLRALDVRVTLKAAGETVSIRNFRSAAVAAASTATLAQTGGGLPMLSIAAGLIGLMMIGAGMRRLALQPRR